MCIIIHKPVGKTVDLATLKQCWERNHDGAGFMFAHEGRVHGNKGYMTFDSLIQGLTDSGFYRKGKLTGKYAVTIHFRWASHGSVKPANCHPFPVTDELKVLKAKYWEADCGVAHNGVIPILRPYKDISDTMAYILTRLYEVYDRLNERNIYNEMAQETRGSRLFVLYSDGSYVLSGDWIEDNGVLYSNMMYKPEAPIRRARIQGFRPTAATTEEIACDQVYDPTASGFVQMYHRHRDWVEEMQAKSGQARKEPSLFAQGLKRK